MKIDKSLPAPPPRAHERRVALQQNEFCRQAGATPGDADFPPGVPSDDGAATPKNTARPVPNDERRPSATPEAMFRRSPK